jgi:Asp-tRNA(Asn)/Glu-tRNA(Gln) amidotransferase C subunit
MSNFGIQIKEDEIQKTLDLKEDQKDEEAKERLTRELNHIPTLISSHENEPRGGHEKPTVQGSDTTTAK